jgi:hypothetical protein
MASWLLPLLVYGAVFFLMDLDVPFIRIRCAAVVAALIDYSAVI